MKIGDWIAFFFLVISLIILWEFRQILLLLFTSVILAIALNGLVRWLQRFRLSRGQAVFLAISLVSFVGIMFFSLIMPPFLDQFQQLLNLVPRGYERFTRWIDFILQQPPIWLPEINLRLPGFTEIARQVGPLAQNILGNFFAVFNFSVNTLLQGLLIFVFTLMLVANPASYRRVVVRLFPSFYRRRADEILGLCEISLLQWMRGIVINSVFIATLSYISLTILNVEFVLAHALLAGVFNLVPNIGPTLSVVFPVSVALLDSPGKAFLVLVAYIIIQNLESYWFSPMIMQRQISLLPAATLMAQLFFARFLGFGGLVLALPLAVVTKTWLEQAVLKDIFDNWTLGQPLLESSDISESEQVLIAADTPPELPDSSPNDSTQEHDSDDGEI
ncbi:MULTISPECIES: AI-2E family transporter [Limnospira]|uniref:AI-2E family transporter n=1 Tax=Limnospira TaxID=2596745 RepID=UPI00061B5945|nr:AI-2E family transporter [Limnospira indica]MDY7052389.1 AI-2E family transporter [Limnospira fusiformis LS22]QNH57807.1 MAG: AI-2E family transporter [Limnospira indica BM01]